ncbi:MAG: hypothetical protein ACM3PX_09965 [Omnitrophica WOR_2 bacterium]|jgi:hypothetical protein
MKTKLIFAILFLLFNTIILSGRNLNSVNAGNDTLSTVSTTVILPEVDEETYINDIPFDTKAIALKSLTLNPEKLQADAYMNDIPFDTEKITESDYYKALSIRPEEESYVDDIPFNTSDIVQNYMLNESRLAVQPDNTKCSE